MTLEKHFSKVFWLTDEGWLQHANPISVRSRFIIMPLFVLAIRSRVWIGWYVLLPVFLLIIRTVINPTFFSKPKTTKVRASKCVLGEKILANRKSVPIPEHHITWRNILMIIQLVGAVALIYGLYTLHFWITCIGLILVYLGKMWFLDRMVRLFEDMKHHPEYEKLDY